MLLLVPRDIRWRRFKQQNKPHGLYAIGQLQLLLNIVDGEYNWSNDDGDKVIDEYIIGIATFFWLGKQSTTDGSAAFMHDKVQGDGDNCGDVEGGIKGGSG